MTDVFISYSRRDLDFVQKLDTALTAEGKTVWFDQKTEPLEGIVPGAKWWEQIKDGIEAADNFLFVISLASMASPYCNAEVAYALAHEKRVVTVLYHGEQSETETLSSIGDAIDAIPPDSELSSSVSATVTNLRALTRRNWLEISQVQYVPFSIDSAFDHSLNLLVRGLDTDLAWIKTWGQVRQVAQIWAETGDSSYLWSEMRLKPVRAEIEERGQELKEVEREFLRSEQERLLEELEDISTTHQRRSSIGERLAAIGDTRPGVGLRPDGLPDIVWCEVQGGEVELEDGKGIFAVQPFYIAKFPITFMQFQAFLDDPEGFEHDTWWEEGEEEYRKQPMEEQRLKSPNQPRENVSWYQTMAFCRWLTAKLPSEAWPIEHKTQGEMWSIRLPNDWEWQQAATGGNPKNEYPWGAEWNSVLANTYEAGVGSPIAVGMYPQNVSPIGTLDMCGNVMEWCLTHYYFPDRTVTNPLSTVSVRGGSCQSYYEDAHNEFRYAFNTERTHAEVGFRVVVAVPMEHCLR